ncbi:PadR family transcriptional regulator [Haloarchaeobius sp. HRN-SO-5]|uniref:PadR family transcriptional regulator n=1 Tax=Haloarchaeobius sp. HRN-SO-5 TaxID=3446118 RepID=UPI003EBA33D9
MTKFIQSGRRRDICILLYDAGELTAQKLKTRLERHYDERIEPKSFYGALDALESAGFVETHTEGLYDVYSLTDAGRARLREHVDWVVEQTSDDG